MPLGLGLKDTFRAIPDRIEVSGHGSSWMVTAGSFAAAVEYAATRFDSFAITGHRLRDAWWRRVTLWLTTDPADISRATAMRLEQAAPLTGAAARMLTPTEMSPEATAGRHPNGNGAGPAVVDILSLEDHTPSWVRSRRTRQAPELPPTLEGIFARAEARRLDRRANALRDMAETTPGVVLIPRQRDAAPGAEAPPVTTEGELDER